ncbi:hypothetical protein KL925_004382 [Ogataea polymorpha]|nr:hypothetical protein KL908_004262 [Ogataea polymorpha]KAG7925367.1 hypothetical protein KL925_004382 [Ogataea polymorpha]
MFASHVRYFSTSLRLRAIKVPDNAPTLEENSAWLKKLARFSITPKPSRPTELPKSTYEIRQVSELESETNPDFIKLRLPGGKHVNVVKKADPHSQPGTSFFTLSVPASDYFVASSPFSRLPSSKRPKADSSQSFADLKVVKVRSGKGGNGAVSFFRDTGIAVGPPDGGDGGDGGNIYVSAVEGLSSLHSIKAKYVAGDGGNGQSGQLDGKRGEDVYIQVPVGTTMMWCADPKEIRSLRDSENDQVFHVKASAGSRRDRVPRNIQFFRDSYEPGKGWIFKEKDEQYHMERDFFVDLNERVKLYDEDQRYHELMDDVFPIQGIDFAEPTKEPILAWSKISSLSSNYWQILDWSDCQMRESPRYCAPFLTLGHVWVTGSSPHCNLQLERYSCELISRLSQWPIFLEWSRVPARIEAWV